MQRHFLTSTLSKIVAMLVYGWLLTAPIAPFVFAKHDIICLAPGSRTTYQHQLRVFLRGCCPDPLLMPQSGVSKIVFASNRDGRRQTRPHKPHNTQENSTNSAIGRTQYDLL